MEVRIIKIFLFVVMLSLLNACYYDNEEDLYPNNECNLDGVTYSNKIKPILESKCYVCHATSQQQGNINVENFDKLKTIVNNGKLLGALKHQSGFIAMPQGSAKLENCDIQAIESWISQGAPEN